jgi:dTDP-4-dehydrorhamnose reductase
MRWLVTGASGSLGAYLLHELAMSERSVHGWSGSTNKTSDGVTVAPIELGNADAVTTAFRASRPDIVVHAGAMARISDCQRSPDRALQVNMAGTEQLAELSAKRGARLIYLSTDLVFDGNSPPYRENSPTNPLSVYGRTKSAAEPIVQNLKNGVVVRLSLLFGPTHNQRPAMFDAIATALLDAKPIALFADEWRTPLGLLAAARALHALARSDFTGLIHLGGPERLSRLELGQRLAKYLNVSGAGLTSAGRDSIAGAEPRPRDVSLDSTLWRTTFPKFQMPSFETALSDMLTK